MITDPIDIFGWNRFPDEIFITAAKQAGLKFTFGTDSRNEHAAHFYYCYQMAQKCGVTEGDMFVVKGKATTTP